MDDYLLSDCGFLCIYFDARISKSMLNIQSKIFTLIFSRDGTKARFFSSVHKDVKMHESSQSIYYINTSYETSLGNEKIDYFSRQQEEASSFALFLLESRETAEDRLYPTFVASTA